MRSGLTGKLEPRLAYLLPVMMISPSLVWMALDKSVWMWDEASYAKGSVHLFHVLRHAPRDWVSQMLDSLRSRAPGVTWLGQLFVPLGSWLGSIDAGLLSSILVTQALTLVLAGQALRELSGGNALLTVTGCLVVASAPLFVGMSHQYLAEPLQLMAVTWFFLIMSFAPRWSRPFVLAQLLAAAAVALLAKATSPLYCVGPGLVALSCVCRPHPGSLVKGEWRQKRVLVTLAAGILLSLAAVGWYHRNMPYVVQHVSDASSGPLAEIYGRRDTFLNTVLYWLGTVQTSLFLPGVFLLVGSLVVLAVIRRLGQPRAPADHFTLCTAIAVLELVLVLAALSLSSNREERYLLPLLPYLSVLICWGLAQMSKPLLTGLTLLVFSGQLANAYGQALGIVAPTARWLLPPNSISGPRESSTLNAIVTRACTQVNFPGYSGVIGIDLPWLNNESADYFAAKSPALAGWASCRFSTVRNFPESPDETWRSIVATRIRYYVTVNPDLHPVGEDLHSRAINQNYLPMLERVETSGLFEREPPLTEDPGVWIFRRKDIDAH